MRVPCAHGRSAVTALAVMAAFSPSAQASGDLLSRPLVKTSIAECPAKLKLWERAWVYLDAYGWSQTVGIACLKDNTAAKWALVATTMCSDLPPEIGSDDYESACFTRTAHAFPALVGDNNFSNLPGNPPYRVKYSAVNFILGKDCQLKTIGPDPEYYSNAWACASVSIVDGSHDKAGRPIDVRDKLRIKDIVSVSNSQFVSTSDEAPLSLEEGAIPMQLFGADDAEIIYDMTSAVKSALAAKASASTLN